MNDFSLSTVIEKSIFLNCNRTNFNIAIAKVNKYTGRQIKIYIVFSNYQFYNQLLQILLTLYLKKIQ